MNVDLVKAVPLAEQGVAVSAAGVVQQSSRRTSAARPLRLSFHSSHLPYSAGENEKQGISIGTY